MGMTIDEHKEQLKKLKSFHNGSYGASINSAVDIMRKYQRIKEIIEGDTYQPSNGFICGGFALTDDKKIGMIREVLKDGEK